MQKPELVTVFFRVPMNVELENKDISSLSQTQRALKHTHTSELFASDSKRRNKQILFS